MITNYLNKVLDGRDLTSKETEDAISMITQGRLKPSQTGAFLAALRMKGESLDELVGAARILRQHVRGIDTGSLETLDTCGTGGDGADTFNISTTAALVAAGAGVKIAKHGNRSVSSKCGSADVLSALGLNLDADPSRMEESIFKNGICFLFARKLHPVMNSVGAIRGELKIRTIFNMLGPLANPAGASAQLLGVYKPELTELFAEALKKLGVKRAMVVHGNDGLDEITPAATTRVSELKNGEISTYELYPELLIGETFPASDLKGGNAEFNAAITLDVLRGTSNGACHAATVMNAGAAIYLAGIANDIQEGITLADKSIRSGAAEEKLTALVEESQYA